jgi:hypothetical protein
LLWFPRPGPRRVSDLGVARYFPDEFGIRRVVSYTLATLLRICEALDVRLTTMLAELEQRSIGKAR